MQARPSASTGVQCGRAFKAGLQRGDFLGYLCSFGSIHNQCARILPPFRQVFEVRLGQIGHLNIQVGFQLPGQKRVLPLPAVAQQAPRHPYDRSFPASPSARPQVGRSSSASAGSTPLGRRRLGLIARTGMLHRIVNITRADSRRGPEFLNPECTGVLLLAVASGRHYMG